MKRSSVLIAVTVVLVSCSPSNDRFEKGPDLAAALRDGGVPCEYTPDEALTGFPIQIPKGESWGQCGGLAIYVLGNKNALQRLREGQAAAADNTPRIYWVYGENWFVASEYQTLRDQVHDALGGQATDNTKV